MKDKKIFILYGGESSEREVSINTGKAAYNTLTEAGYTNLTLFDTVRSSIVKLPAEKPDICLLALHGTHGEDGVIQGYLEMLGIPYTCSGVAASAVAFDKHLSKICFEHCNVPTPEYWLFDKKRDVQISFPCVIKPSREGSTVGITIVKDAANYESAVELAMKYDSKVLVEKFIKGKEITVSIVNEQVLPPIWIKPNSGFYDYKSKYTKGATEYLFELGLDAAEEQLIKDTALKAYNAVGCSSVARVDIMYDGKTPYVLEVNTIPGMTQTSLLPKAAAKAGIPFARLLEIMLEDGIKRVTKGG